MKSHLKVYLADDHTIFRTALVSLLRTFDRVAVVKEAANGKELITLVRQDRPDVVFVDLQMPRMDGAETCEYLLSHRPGIKVIVLTMHDNERYVRHMMEMGVHAFLKKDASLVELERALYAVVDKDFYHNDLVANALRRGNQGESVRPRSLFELSSLTKRERQVLKLIYEELTIREISARLSISENTVRNHRVNIMRKAGVKNTVGLVKYAYESGLVV